MVIEVADRSCVKCELRQGKAVRAMQAAAAAFCGECKG